MNEKPQEALRDEQEDLLKQIIAQSLEQTSPPAETATAGDPSADGTPSAPKQEDGGTAALPAEKNRRSAVYLYLLILFGAAFLMLLLAYFVQQRSSETTISDLHDSMNLSRQELLDEIRALEEENDALNGEIDQLQSQLAQWQERYNENDREATDLWNQYYDTQEELYSWQSFWTLERYYQAGDLQNCAAVLILQGQGQYRYRSPDPTRQQEIVKAVIDAGILNEDYLLHPGAYEDLLEAYFDRQTND